MARICYQALTPWKWGQHSPCSSGAHPPEIQVLRCGNLLLTQPQGQGRIAKKMKPIFKKAPRLARAHLGILVSNLGWVRTGSTGPVFYQETRRACEPGWAIRSPPQAKCAGVSPGFTPPSTLHQFSVLHFPHLWNSNNSHDRLTWLSWRKMRKCL